MRGQLLLKDTHAAALLDGIQDVKKRWHKHRLTGDREAFDRMSQMTIPAFARREAEKLAGFVKERDRRVREAR